MKLSLFRSRSSRERRVLERAMRESDAPAPPAGLKERLIEQAQAAAREATPQPMRRWSAAWAISAVVVVLAVMAGWLALNGGQHVKQAERPPVPRTRPASVVERKTPPPTPEKPKLLVQRPYKKHRVMMKHRATPKPANEKGRDLEPVRDEPVITVTVGRADDKTVRYAQAAAWGTDDDGKPVKTQWTLVDDPRKGVTSEQLTKTDASGHAVLVVAVVTPSDDGELPKGDRL